MDIAWTVRIIVLRRVVPRGVQACNGDMVRVRRRNSYVYGGHPIAWASHRMGWPPAPFGTASWAPSRRSQDTGAGTGHIASAASRATIAKALCSSTDAKSMSRNSYANGCDLCFRTEKKKIPGTHFEKVSSFREPYVRKLRSELETKLALHSAHSRDEVDIDAWSQDIIHHGWPSSADVTNAIKISAARDQLQAALSSAAECSPKKCKASGQPSMSAAGARGADVVARRPSLDRSSSSGRQAYFFNLCERVSCLICALHSTTLPRTLILHSVQQ